ncbi:MAG: DUF2162 family putative transporter [Archaeoglobales archaeon]|nr:DUF2162 family putative transporter [Archaeoglobales archaeon]
MKLYKTTGALIFTAVLLVIVVYTPLLMGIVASSAIVALKAGIGCRYSSLGRRAIYFLALFYLSLAIALVFLLENIMSSLSGFLNYTIAFHLIVASLLFLAGYMTIKKASCGIDLSSKTSLAIAVPCPVCFAAIFISCYFALQILEIPRLAIGAIVGAIIALGILILSLEKKENPERLGKIMLLLGVYYFFAMLLIPAVIEGMSFKFSIEDFFSPYSLILLIPITLGAIRGAMRYV